MNDKNYCIVTNGIIENIIVCDSEETAAQFKALPGYYGAAIGGRYDPPSQEPEYTSDDLFRALLGSTLASESEGGG